MDRVRVVFPVRFSFKGTAVQTTTRDLSPEGVYVRCLLPPPKGSEVQLKLYMPGEAPPIEARGLVAEVESGGESGFRAGFVALGVAQRRQLEAVLDRLSRAAPIGAVDVQTAAGEPRRTFPRVNAHFAVRFATVQDFVLEYAANISAGGVFIRTENPPPLKSVVRVELELPGGSAVTAQGLVVHRVTPEDAAARGNVAGAGVQFIAADDTFRQRIDAAIDAMLKEAGT